MNKMRVLLLSLLLSCAAEAVRGQPSYDYARLQREQLGRGMVVVRDTPESVVLSWRYLSCDALATAFNIYRDGEQIAQVPPTAGTFYRDRYASNQAATYRVAPTIEGVEQHDAPIGFYTLPQDAPIGYIDIPLDVPADGVTPAGETYSYNANDASIGDVDGDGEYEIILKWDPTNSKDNAFDGYTGNVFVDCYRLSGERLWRIDLGRNIRAGAHYTQFLVYDFDGDGKAEVVMKTADGTIDGVGQAIGDAAADYREVGDESKRSGGDFPRRDPRNDNFRGEQPRGERPALDSIALLSMPPQGAEQQGTPPPPRGERPSAVPYNQGRVMTGNEYLTVFEGLTGKALQTVDYLPPRGDIAAWGDNRANRADRFLAAVAYLDGCHPSIVMCRGYYTRTVVAAFDWDGTTLTNRWVFDTDARGNKAYAGQGNHNLRVGDVDGDGCDEIIYGSCAINNDGTGLYSTGFGHGDALHMTRFALSLTGLQVWDCHENKHDGSSFRDAKTGKVIFQIKDKADVGRCMAADIDPTNEGLELWSSRSGGIRTVRGDVLCAEPKGLPVNMAVWWDGDLLREMLDGNVVSKYDWTEGVCRPLATFEGTACNNGTKKNPSLQGDIIGDWREEVLLRTEDNTSLRLYVSPIDTDYRFHTFLEDPIYRISIATQNVGYNQPTQPGFYFGSDLREGLFRGYDFSK